MKRIIALISAVIMCFSLISCGSETQKDSNSAPADSSIVMQETPADSSQPDDGSDSTSNIDSISVEDEDKISDNGFLPGILTYADFEVTDYRNTGFHNLVDYFTANPNGTGNTFTECGISVFYTAAEADLIGEDAIAYRTPRGIGLGAAIDDVLDAYGNVTVEDATDMPQYGLLAAGQNQITVANYQCRIGSGACPRITFIFDQNNKVIHISMSAVYQKFVNDNVLAQTLPYN